MESGTLLVRVWSREDEVDVDVVDTNLKPGDFMQVKPRLYHQFEGIKAGVAFELYWAEFNHGDIIRETFGKEI